MKRVLFLCTGNSCRSQMAEGFLREFGGKDYSVFSAGTEPSALHPLAVRVMGEEAIDISAQESTDVAEYLGQEFDVIITVCENARRKCPVFPGRAERIHWNVEDPAAAEGGEERRVKQFRRIRDEIKQRVLFFLKDRNDKRYDSEEAAS